MSPINFSEFLNFFHENKNLRQPLKKEEKKKKKEANIEKVFTPRGLTGKLIDQMRGWI